MRHTSIVEPSNLRATYGTVLNIHGGGWKSEQDVAPCGGGTAHPDLPHRSHNGKIDALPGEPSQSRWCANRGWRFISVGYTGGYPCSLRDAFRSLDSVRRRYGGPVCVIGGSAGGHLALLTAARRDVDCVISMGGPVELNGLCGVCFQAPAFATSHRETAPSPTAVPHRQGRLREDSRRLRADHDVAPQRQQTLTRDQPAATEGTGGSRVATVDQLAPASAEPKTSPEVAPK